MKNIFRFISGIPPFSTILNISRRLILPGFNGLPLFDVAVFFVNGLKQGDIQMRARSLAFSFFLALFPLIIFLFTLIPYIPIANFQEQLLELLGALLPPYTYQASYQTIEDIITHQRSGLLSFGFLFTLYISANGVNAMIESFNHSFHSFQPRSPFKQRLTALCLTIVLALLFFLSITLIIVTEYSSHFISKHHLLGSDAKIILLQAGKWIILLGLCFTALSFLYTFGPSRKIKWKFISAGSTLATILIVLTSIGFNYFISNFASYNKIYGSIGTLIVILLWIYFNMLPILIGFELNASIKKAQSHLEKKVV